MTEVEVPQPQPETTTYGWLSSLPLAASAGAAVYNAYEGSKNYNYVTQCALGSVENSVKIAASAVAPVVKRLDKPIHAVDSYTASKLIQLEEKVPAIKSQPEEVVAYLNETKEALASKVTEGRTAISTRITEGKDAVTGSITSGKEIVYSKISAGKEAIVNSRPGIAVSEGKEAIAGHLARGKESLGNTIASGRDVVYTKIQTGAEQLANTRAGVLVGSGVDRTLSVTENLVEYLLPEVKIEKELVSQSTSGKQELVGLPRTRSPSDDSPAEADEEDEPPVAGRAERVYTLSHKVKLRMHFHSMQKLQAMQQNCKSTLEQLKQAVDLLQLAQAAREGMDKQYQNVTSALKELEDQIKQLLSRQQSKTGMSWLPNDDEDEESVKVGWLTPASKSQGVLQSSLDYAKQLSEKVFRGFQSVTVATTYLPSHLKGGATQGYQYAQEMYSTLKPVQSPTDLSSSALNRISTLLETQLGYVTRLGTYLSSVLQKPAGAVSSEDPPATEDDSGKELSDSENDEPKASS